LPSKFSDSPVAIDTFDFIENPLERIINLDEFYKMAEGKAFYQPVGQCLTNFRIDKIKLATEFQPVTM